MSKKVTAEFKCDARAYSKDIVDIAQWLKDCPVTPKLIRYKTKAYQVVITLPLSPLEFTRDNK